MAEIDPEWFRGFFQERYLQLVAETPAEADVDFIMAALDLQPGARVLDLACGHGRHSLELARRGVRVTGVDLSEPSLVRARQAAAEAGLEVDWVHSDMREIEFEAEFDAVINMFHAFGYFQQESEDLHVLTLIARALKPKAGFLLDVVNAVRVFREYAAQGHRYLDDGTVMVEDRSYDGVTGRNNVVWTFIAPDGSRSEISHSIRMYTLPEIVRLLDSASLTFERAWGDFDGSSYTPFSSRRMIVKAARP